MRLCLGRLSPVELFRIEGVMPYFKTGESATDKNGAPIKEGDILQGPQWAPGEPCYYVCIAGWERDTWEVRDLNAWNVCMCDLGPSGDVVNLGHYSDNPGILDDEVLEQHFKKPATEQWQERENAQKWLAENPTAMRDAITEEFKGMLYGGATGANPLMSAMDKHGGIKTLDGGATIEKAIK